MDKIWNFAIIITIKILKNKRLVGGPPFKWATQSFSIQYLTKLSVAS